MKFPLNKPIQAHGVEVHELELREPTGQEILDTGFPYLVVIGDGDEQAMEIRAKVVGKYISKLASIPPSAVGQLSGPDLSGLMGVVLGFFGVEAGA